MARYLSSGIFHNYLNINRLKGYILGELLFGCDMILLIKHIVDWELIRQQNQTQINKHNIHENTQDFIMTIKLAIKSRSSVMLHTNMKRNITGHL